MKKASDPCEAPSERSEPVRERLNRFAIAAVLAAVGVLALAWPVEAKVVYTPVDATILGNGYIKIDLNHDKIADFVIHSVSKVFVCGNRGGLMGFTNIIPKTGDGVVVSNLNVAELLASGIAIGAGADFYKAHAVVTQFVICSGGTYSAGGYLGLEFQINGQTHYGWAQVNIFAAGQRMRTTLVDFAYETTPGQAIKTGQTSGAAEGLDPENPEN
jgi:hypothetical protein